MRKLAVGICLSLLAATQAQVKFIATGWDEPSPSDFAKHHMSFADLPFDGAAIEFDGGPAGLGEPFRSAFGPEVWSESWFDAGVQQVKGALAKSGNPLTHNFLKFHANPGKVDWFDDKSWVQIIDHFRIGARVAKRAGLKGWIFDPEAYVKPYVAFAYNAQPGSKTRTFAEYTAKARQRGRDGMAKVAAEFPEMTILMYHCLNSVAAAPGRNGLEVEMGTTMDLFPAFLDGMIQVAPRTITFIDGNESAYLYQEPTDFLLGSHKIRNENLTLLSAESQAKYRSQLRVAHAIYLDAYFTEATDQWYVPPLGNSRMARLYQNAAWAKRTSDSYVWVYGEEKRWWPGKRAPWGKEVTQALALARDPQAVRASSSQPEILKNGSLSENTTGWWTWKSDSSKGSFEHSSAEKAAHLKGIGNGVFGQNVAVTEGQVLKVLADVKAVGQCRGTLSVGWKNAQGKWLNRELDFRVSGQRTGAYEQLSLVAIPPKGATTAIVMFGISGRGEGGEEVFARSASMRLVPL